MTIGGTRLLTGLAAAVLVLGATGCASSNSAIPAASSSPGSSASSAAGSSDAGTSAAAEPTSASGSGRTAAPATGDAAKLEGTTFVASEVSGSHTLVPGSTLSLSLQDGNLSAKAGCNDLFAQYTLDGYVLVAKLGSTRMACDEALMAQDTWLTAFLESSPTWAYVGGTLTLTNGTDSIVFSPASLGTDALESTG